jgi:hypothetical protein
MAERGGGLAWPWPWPWRGVEREKRESTEQGEWG